MKKFIKIIRTEFNTFFHDAGAMLIMVIGVFAYSLFYSIPYSAEVIKDAPIGLIDMDNSTMSHEFSRDLNSSDFVEIISNPLSIEDAKKEFYKENIRAFLVIPKDFEKDIKKGRQTTVSLYADTSYMIIYKAVYQGVVQTAMETGAKIEVAKLIKKGIPKQMAITLKKPFEFVQTPLYNAQGGYKTYVYPVILILILHQTLIIGLGLMQGTLTELGGKFCRKEKNIPFILFAKCSAYVLLYLFYSVIIFLIFPALFNYPMSYNIVPLFVLLILMYYTAAFFSYTISLFFKARESSLLILVVTSLVFIFIPGLIWPRESMPMIVNAASFFVPATCAIDGITKINYMGATFWDVKYDILWLAFLCFLYFNLSIRVLKEKNK
ncbi:ABC transporter permease [bacterium]|nr:ABC transporter permease [bacterium]MBR1754891.1 ABC transporter permease [bacterium]